MITLKPDFTAEELLYIEKLMDLNAGAGEDRIRKNIEQFMMVQCLADKNEAEKKQFSKILIASVEELYQANVITKNIRTKIEDWRKEIK